MPSTEPNLGLDKKNSRTILVVEDNPDEVVLLSYALERAGITTPVIVVPDGAQAIRYLKGEGSYADRKRFAIPQLILLDLEMPRMTAFEFLQWLRREPEMAHLPVVVLSISTWSPAVQYAYQLGVNSFLTKSADVADFIATVKQMVDSWMDRSQLPTFPMVPPTPKNPVTPPPDKSSG